MTFLFCFVSDYQTISLIWTIDPFLVVRSNSPEYVRPPRSSPLKRRLPVFFEYDRALGKNVIFSPSDPINSMLASMVMVVKKAHSIPRLLLPMHMKLILAARAACSDMMLLQKLLR